MIQGGKPFSKYIYKRKHILKAFKMFSRIGKKILLADRPKIELNVLREKNLVWQT